MSRPVLALDPSGTRLAVPTRYVTGIEATAVRIQTMLQTQRGSWLDDASFGLLYQEWGARGHVPLVEIEAAVRTQVRRIRGVLDIVDVSVSRPDSALSVSVAVTVEGPADEAGRPTTASLIVGDPSGLSYRGRPFSAQSGAVDGLPDLRPDSARPLASYYTLAGV